MRNWRGPDEWFTELDSNALVCGQLHPEYQLPCYTTLGHSTLGATGRDRAHAAHPYPGDWVQDYVWTYVTDHKWRIDQRRRGRHPAGGDER